MNILLSIFVLIVPITFIKAFVCQKKNDIYPHEWNKTTYYQCVNDCAYVKNCPPKTFFSSSTKKCNSEPASWTPRFDLTGRYQWPASSIFIEIRQVGYDVQWTSEDNENLYNFVGRYINETMINGLEIRLTKSSNCISLQDFDLSVLGKRNFCRSRIAFHWYTRTCDQKLSEAHCHVY